MDKCINKSLLLLVIMTYFGLLCLPSAVLRAQDFDYFNNWYDNPYGDDGWGDLAPETNPDDAALLPPPSLDKPLAAPTPYADPNNPNSLAPAAPPPAAAPPTGAAANGAATSHDGAAPSNPYEALMPEGMDNYWGFPSEEREAAAPNFVPVPASPTSPNPAPSVSGKKQLAPFAIVEPGRLGNVDASKAEEKDLSGYYKLGNDLYAYDQTTGEFSIVVRGGGKSTATAAGVQSLAKLPHKSSSRCNYWQHPLSKQQSFDSQGTCQQNLEDALSAAELSLDLELEQQNASLPPVDVLSRQARLQTEVKRPQLQSFLASLGKQGCNCSQ